MDAAERETTYETTYASVCVCARAHACAQKINENLTAV